MATPTKKIPPLTAAVAALEAEVEALEHAVAETTRVRLDSRKQLERSARDVQRTAEIFGRVQKRLADVAAELTKGQTRILGAGQRLQEHGELVAQRQDTWAELVNASESFAAEASALNERAQRGPEALPEVLEGLATLAARAGQSAAAAREAGFRDLAEEASGREQQLNALRNRLAGN